MFDHFLDRRSGQCCQQQLVKTGMAHAKCRKFCLHLPAMHRLGTLSHPMLA